MDSKVFTRGFDSEVKVCKTKLKISKHYTQPLGMYFDFIFFQIPFRLPQIFSHSFSIDEIVEYHKAQNHISDLVSRDVSQEVLEILSLPIDAVHEELDSKNNKVYAVSTVRYVEGKHGTELTKSKVYRILKESGVRQHLTSLIMYNLSDINLREDRAGKIIITDLGKSVRGFMKQYKTSYESFS